MNAARPRCFHAESGRLVQARGSVVHYEDVGEGTPIVTLHGYAADHRLASGWLEPVFSGLPGYRRLYPDIPGMGKSIPAPDLRNADEMLETLIDWIAAVLGDQPFVLAGQSYGGYLALGMLCSRMAARVSGCMLLCPVTRAGRAERTLPPHARLLADDALLSHKHSRAFDDFLSFAVSATADAWARYQAEILPGLQAANSDFIDRFRRKGYALSCQAQFSSLRFDKPALVALGRQDATVGFADALALLQGFSRATFAVLDGGGHNLHLDRPEPLAALTRDWLARLTGR